MRDLIISAIYDCLFGMSLEAVARHFGLPLNAPEIEVRAKLGNPARAAVTEYMAAINDWLGRRSYPGYLAIAMQAEHFARAIAGRYTDWGGYTLGEQFLTAPLAV